MNILEYLGSELEHINFNSDEQIIIEKINQYIENNNIKKLSYDEIEYLIYTAALYELYNVLNFIQNKFTSQYNMFVTKNDFIIDILITK